MSKRVMASSRRDLRQVVVDGRLREDLYYQIAATVVGVPPLRKRREDIAPLALELFAHAKAAYERGLTLADGTLAMLQSRDWPGNVRELRLQHFEDCRAARRQSPNRAGAAARPRTLPLRQARARWMTSVMRRTTGPPLRLGTPLNLSADLRHRGPERLGKQRQLLGAGVDATGLDVVDLPGREAAATGDVGEFEPLLEAEPAKAATDLVTCRSVHVRHHPAKAGRGQGQAGAT